MGKKGSWFSAIKRVFIPSSKEKHSTGSEKKNSKEKKKGRGILKHGETKSFIPLFREPSSIEKILGEADEQKLLFQPPASSEQATLPALPVRPISPRVISPKPGSQRFASARVSSPSIASPRAASPRVTSPKASPPRATSPIAAPPRVTSPRVASPKARAPSPTVNQKRKDISYIYRPEQTLRNNLAATKIQAAYRGYMSRRSFRALRGLVRLQGVVRGHNVKRQTMNAMKQMQLLVRVQTQIQSRRIQMLENQALQRQAHKHDKEAESTFSKWTLNRLSEAGQNEDWDDSLLTKEEVEERLRRKVEAVIKRERAMAYAYSHQLWKGNPKSAQAALDFRSNGYPWWWNWLERQLPPANPAESQGATRIAHTPPRSVLDHKPSPRVQTSNYRHHHPDFDNHDSLTPRSTMSAVPVRAKQFYTPSRTPPTASSGLMKYSRPRASAANSPFDIPLKDDDSMTSCPPFSVPNYMAQTISAKAKVRPSSNPKERYPATPGNDSNRRFSFPLTPTLGSFKWNKGSGKDSTPQRELVKHQSKPSIGDLSVDSTVSMPAAVGRKPFNRFV